MDNKKRSHESAVRSGSRSRSRERRKHKHRHKDKQPSKRKRSRSGDRSASSGDGGRRRGSRENEQPERAEKRSEQWPRRRHDSPSSASSRSASPAAPLPRAAASPPGIGSPGPPARNPPAPLSADQLLELQRLQQARRRQKDILKALETPEQKRARRLAKKDAKERKRKAEMGWDDEYLGYTNADNPFGDKKLLESFVWNKKLEKEGLETLETVKLEELQRKRLEENRQELERVKVRRAERQREQAEVEREREMMQRDKEADFYREWSRQEETFHLRQARLRSKVRIEDGRAKPIDLLAQYINPDVEDKTLSIELHEPTKYIQFLTEDEYEDLLADIQIYCQLERDNADHLQFWTDVQIATKDELDRLRQRVESCKEEGRSTAARRTGINRQVATDVTQVFNGKSARQLEMLQDEIERKLKAGQGVDVAYWESLQSQLKAHMARQRLLERHQQVLQSRLFIMKEEQGLEHPSTLFPSAANMAEPAKTEPVASTSSAAAAASTSSVRQHAANKTDLDDDFSDLELPTERQDALQLDVAYTDEQAFADYAAAGFSPARLQTKDLELDAVVYEAADDRKKLEFLRRQMRRTGTVDVDLEAALVARAKEGMGGDEAQFSVEAPLKNQTFMWSDKYKPRKPRFFNRVHTGYEWNKYNQTHYDVDNPPPKIVQGYKFNIFYPDLIDKAQTPAFDLLPDDINRDFAILRFKAGPPYEDIAFKIVRREWETSYRRGFKCQFQNGIFQLWFHYKKYKYRR